MADYETTVPSSWDPVRTFDYLADFRCVAEWDPSITKAVLLSGEPGAEGATYEISVSIAGTESVIPYTAVTVQRPHRIVMRGETDALVSTDTVTVTDRDRDRDGATVTVTYRAVLELKGIRKMVDPLAEIVLTRASEKAREGLANKLAALP